MTETRLQARAHSLAYGLCILAFALLGYINLRYGFYSLFYASLLLVSLAAAGIGYSLRARRHPFAADGHGAILVLMTLTVLWSGHGQPELGIFWLFPLILLDLLILCLRRGLLLAGMSILLMGSLLLFQDQGLMAVAGLLSALLLGAMAAFFAFRYHYRARSLGELTTTEPITGAFNARYFDETLRREISRSDVTGHPLSLLHLAIDFYDELEALQGENELHPLLERVSEALRKAVRAGDSHYYLGHGEFLLLLPFTPEEGVRVIAERIRRMITESPWPVVDSITVSLGGVSRYAGEQHPEVLAKGARSALAEARKRGGNRTYHLNMEEADVQITANTNP